MTVFLLLLVPFVYGQSWDIHRWPTPDNGEDVEVLSVDEGHQAITLKFFTNASVGEYKVVSCYIDNSSNIEWDGESAPLSSLYPGAQVFSSGTLFRQSVRSCGSLSVLDGK